MSFGYLNMDFKECLRNLVEHGMQVKPRGSDTRELLNYNITVLDPRNRVITAKARNTNTRYLLGEFIWYAGGSRLPDGILPYSKFWNNILNSGNESGYPEGTVNSNYGNRLFGFCDLPAFDKKNQWQETIDILTKDKDSRQAIMNIHVPSDRHEGNKDVPCTLSLQWFIREDKLHLVCNMRSNDVIRGFTNDVFQFTMLQEAMLVNLREVYPELELGHYFHNAGSMHLYSLHYEMVDKILAEENTFDLTMIQMDVFNTETILALQSIDEEFQAADAPDDFDFTKTYHWSDLSPYWQTCVLALMGKDEDSMHTLFNANE